MSNINPSRPEGRRFSSISFRMLAAVCMAVLALGVGTTTVRAQSREATKGATVRDMTLPTSDGWRLAVTYYESTLGKEAPVVILLHSRGGNRLVWANGFAKRLQDEGYAVVAIDLRKHGQSSLPALATLPPARRARFSDELRNIDYPLMVDQDLDAVKDFLYDEHQAQKLNMRKTAIIAADMTAPIAVVYTLADWLKKPYPDAPTLAARTPRGQDVRALVLLSPDDNLPGLRTGPALNTLRTPLWNIAFLICVGEQDSQDRGKARRMHQQLTATAGNDARMYLKNYKTKYRGTDLIGKRLGVEEHILAFLQKHVKELSGEGNDWRDRKSRFEN